MIPGQAVDLKDLDRLDVLHRFDGLADDTGQVLDEVLVDRAAPRGIVAHILGLVESGLALGVLLVADRGRIRLGDLRDRSLLHRLLLGRGDRNQAAGSPARFGRRRR